MGDLRGCPVAQKTHHTAGLRDEIENAISVTKVPQAAVCSTNKYLDANGYHFGDHLELWRLKVTCINLMTAQKCDIEMFSFLKCAYTFFWLTL